MSVLIHGVLGSIATIIYILIGWFVRSLLQEDWEAPSLFLAMLWPIALVLYGIALLFTAVSNLAEKIKENKDD